VASYTRTSFTATAGQTTFTATYTVGYVQVYLNGVFLNGSDYTATNGTSVVLATAAALNDIIEIIALNVNSIGTGPTGATGPAGTGGASWQAVQTGNFTAVAGNGYFVNTTSGAITVTLPASPSAGNFVQVVDYAGTFPTNNCTIERNGSNINGVALNLTLSGNRSSIALVYGDATQGWLPYSGFATSPFLTSYVGTYVIVGGGGGSTGGVNSVNYGAGGAGGTLRTSTATLTSGVTYTVTVGGGGAGSATTAGSGVTSSIIGGSGATLVSVSATGGNGGVNTVTTGAANADFTGGAAAGSFGAGGGAGAGANGGSNNGGSGVSTTISGSTIYYGGGGAGRSSVTSTGGAGGGGNSDTAGTVNTGGGGGGTNFGSNFGGGSGIVILSVPSANYTGITTGSPTITTNGSNTVMKFTASGSYTA
jgi:hypothetical protein